jgi:hypothetical protein
VEDERQHRSPALFGAGVVEGVGTCEDADDADDPDGDDERDDIEFTSVVIEEVDVQDALTNVGKLEGARFAILLVEEGDRLGSSDGVVVTAAIGPLAFEMFCVGGLATYISEMVDCIYSHEWRREKHDFCDPGSI